MEIPVFTSPLLLVPVVSRMIGRSREVGIIVASKASLTEPFLEAAGVDASIPYTIAGLESSAEFNACFMGGTRTVMDVDRLREDVVGVAGNLVREQPKVGAIILECSALPPAPAHEFDSCSGGCYNAY